MDEKKTFLLRAISRLPGPEGLKKSLHEIMVIVAYLLLIIDYILKNPPPIPGLGK